MNEMRDGRDGGEDRREEDWEGNKGEYRREGEGRKGMYGKGWEIDWNDEEGNIGKGEESEEKLEQKKSIV